VPRGGGQPLPPAGAFRRGHHCSINDGLSIFSNPIEVRIILFSPRLGSVIVVSLSLMQQLRPSVEMMMLLSVELS
jgi:hypothetical protein